MDLKVKPKSYKGHKYIIDEVTNYLITVPIHQAKWEEIGDALTENVITKYCIPQHIIMGQDNAWIKYIFSITGQNLTQRQAFTSLQHGFLRS